jgi:hypothetical protein
MTTNLKVQTKSRRALIGTLAALTLTLAGLTASAGDAAAGGLAGGIGGDTHRSGEEIPTLRGGLAGGIGGGDSGSIVIPQ